MQENIVKINKYSTFSHIPAILSNTERKFIIDLIEGKIKEENYTASHIRVLKHRIKKKIRKIHEIICQFINDIDLLEKFAEKTNTPISSLFLGSEGSWDQDPVTYLALKAAERTPNKQKLLEYIQKLTQVSEEMKMKFEEVLKPMMPSVINLVRQAQSIFQSIFKSINQDIEHLKRSKGRYKTYKKIFEKFRQEKNKPLHRDILAKACKKKPTYISRLMNILTEKGIFKEIKPNTWQPTLKAMLIQTRILKN